MYRTPAISLYSGPSHVCEAMNEVQCSLIEDRTCIGIPVRETWTDRVYRPIQALMDAVYVEHEPIILAVTFGLLVILPRWDQDCCVGVATVYWGDLPAALRARIAQPHSVLARAFAS